MTNRKQVAADKKDSSPRPLLISINEAAKRLGVCRKTIENLLYKKNKLRPVRIPRLRRVMISEKDVERLIREGMR
jgi:excisionase family DNA binding protein